MVRMRPLRVDHGQRSSPQVGVIRLAGPLQKGPILLQVLTHQTVGVAYMRSFLTVASDRDERNRVVVTDAGNMSRTAQTVSFVRVEDADQAEAGNARPLLMGNRRALTITAIGALLAALAGSLPGCGTGMMNWRAPSVTKIFSPRPVIANPLVVPSSDFETVWNKTVAVVDKYFEIESENRLSKTIRTHPQMGATMLEPWALDSATFQDRLEASLQTIRRAAVIHIDPAPTGGFLVKVEVYKFLEDLSKPDRQAAGRAVFINDFPINRTREIVGPVPAPLGWIKRGRDLDLEQAILAGVRDALFL